MKKRNYRKVYSKYSTSYLVSEIEKLYFIIKTCEDYIKSAYDTFLGPFGANAKIKECCAKLDVINSILKERESDVNCSED